MEYSEFSLIAHYFNRVKTFRSDVEIGIGDDCALLNVSKNKTLAISTDTLVCGRHFLPNINPADLAYKALAINISDLAAIGADPALLLLALTLPKIDKEWLDIFSNTLFEQLNYYNIQLIGGDTTSGPLSMTLTIMGYVPKGHVIKRDGAQPGDWIYVTGTLGDSAAGLAILQNKLTVSDVNDSSWLIERHLRPTPRIQQGRALRDLASSAIDVSDGLVSDLGHILKTSKVGAQIDLDLFPISMQICRHVKIEQIIHWALSGGEDYELCFTLPEVNRNKLCLALTNLGVRFTCIGKIMTQDIGLQFVRNGIPVTFTEKGYDHFK